MNFKIEKRIAYDRRPPAYYLPYEIGCYSIDSENKYRNDSHQMKYLSMPNKTTDLYMDLNEGFHEYIHVNQDADEAYNYSAMLKWILSHQDLIRNHFTDPFSTSPKIDFVLIRGLLTSVSSTPYENSEDWMIYATKFKTVIYLCKTRTNRKLAAELFATEKQIRMTTWGFKFEQYMVSDTMYSKPDTSIPVNENEKYFAVFKGKFGHHRLLFGAEMDGVNPEYLTASGHDTTSPLRYVELKTSRLITNDKQMTTFRRYKLLKWYLQSFFSGIPQVICGFRNEEGVVRKLQTYKVKSMPELARGYWSPDICLNFGSDFLDHVKKCVVKDKVAYKFYWSPGSSVITCEEMNSDYSFIPNWYTSRLNVF